MDHASRWPTHRPKSTVPCTTRYSLQQASFRFVFVCFFCLFFSFWATPSMTFAGASFHCAYHSVRLVLVGRVLRHSRCRHLFIAVGRMGSSVDRMWQCRRPEHFHVCHQQPHHFRGGRARAHSPCVRLICCGEFAHDAASRYYSLLPRAYLRRSPRAAKLFMCMFICCRISSTNRKSCPACLARTPCSPCSPCPPCPPCSPCPPCPFAPLQRTYPFRAPVELR